MDTALAPHRGGAAWRDAVADPLPCRGFHGVLEAGHSHRLRMSPTYRPGTAFRWSRECDGGAIALRLHFQASLTCGDRFYRFHVRRTMCRSEEHTSELQSLMRISYAVFCLKKNNTHNNKTQH